MAAKLTLIVLACTIVAICNAQTTFKRYSNRLQQQQAAPYPASGFRPDRTFNLPTGEAIAQQLRLAQIKKLQLEYQQQQQLQQQQQQQKQQQQTPNQYYGTPSESEISQSQLPQQQQPSGLYGAPQEEAASNLQPSDFTRPQQPSQQYGAPSEDTSASQLQGQFLRPQQSTSQRQIQFQRQQQPSRQYGAPINKAVPESTNDESLEESKDVENVAPLDNKSGRLTQGNQERDTENDEAETATKTATAATAAGVVPPGFVLVPITAAPAGYTPQKLALFPVPAQASFAKLQYPSGLIGLQQQKLLATPQLLAQQSYYQPQQFAFAAPLQAW